MGLGMEQGSDGHGSHTMHFFHSLLLVLRLTHSLATLTPSLLLSLWSCISKHHTTDPEQNQSLLKLLLTTEPHAELTGCKIFFV